ncbi:MAG: carbon-nitrogen hydrolase family protein [Holophagaceae bacterium]|uniref:Carbon-nitrogen hydrolase family protein n=1 Tax=Candidatus Geothrix skivensis TaxID=2954439 RepID=A0A9D7SHB9_9BACT|nr:carbon-nitrogen hydrolase family protein [Candidatus Geothrix skivensis]
MSIPVLPTTLRVALIQQATVWQEPEANLARGRGFVQAAAWSGARVAVFPELFTLGFTMAPEPFAEAIPGPTVERVGALSKEFGIHLVGSVVEAHGPHPRNAAFVTAPDGSSWRSTASSTPFPTARRTGTTRAGRTARSSRSMGSPAACRSATTCVSRSPSGPWRPGAPR